LGHRHTGVKIFFTWREKWRQDGGFQENPLNGKSAKHKQRYAGFAAGRRLRSAGGSTLKSGNWTASQN